MEKKYIFFDIDGTLTNRETREMIPSAQLALDQLQAAGHFVAIATGRAHYKAINFMKQVGLHNMVCGGGGGLVINDTLIHNTPLDHSAALQVIKQAETLGYGVLVMVDDSIDVYTKNDLFRQQCGERKEPTNYIIDPNFDVSAHDVYKIYISIPKTQEAQLTTRDLLGHLRFVPDYLMFQYDQKNDGIQAMMQHLHADTKDVVVFGDDDNDLVMFDPHWYCVAMGNACEALKQKADYITDANVDDGIWNACVHHGWIKP